MKKMEKYIKTRIEQLKEDKEKAHQTHMIFNGIIDVYKN